MVEDDMRKKAESLLNTLAAERGKVVADKAVEDRLRKLEERVQLLALAEDDTSLIKDNLRVLGGRVKALETRRSVAMLDFLTTLFGFVATMRWPFVAAVTVAGAVACFWLRR